MVINMLSNLYVINVFNKFREKNKGCNEYIQACEEILESIEILFNDERYIKSNILERFLEPERFIEFRVSWLDDNNNVQVNRGYRVQYNSALGPYKGGIRFHKSVNASIIKFLGLEQTLKNALISLPLGGGKGGSDFDPKGKSDYEIMKFSQAFMNELYRHIGSEIDVPAGDIGVGEKEVGYLFGQYKKIKNEFSGTLSGKSLNISGSLLRKEATGYGLCYFIDKALNVLINDSLKDKKVVISGSGNVAIYALKKTIELNAKVIAMSDSNGYIYDELGIDLNTIQYIKETKKERIKEYIKYKKSAVYIENKSIWSIPCDIALPCATQNEITLLDAMSLVKNGVIGVFEGSNMSSSIEASKFLIENDVIYAPSKASNVGGVIVSGLEMSQNKTLLKMNENEVDLRLKDIIYNIFNSINEVNIKFNIRRNNLMKGANILAFQNVAEAMISEGVV